MKELRPKLTSPDQLVVDFCPRSLQQQRCPNCYHGIISLCGAKSIVAASGRRWLEPWRCLEAVRERGVGHWVWRIQAESWRVASASFGNDHCENKKNSTGCTWGLLPAQNIPAHIAHFMSIRVKDPFLYKMRKGLPLWQPLEKWWGGLYTMSVDTLPCVNYKKARVKIKKCLTRHPDEYMEIFAANLFGHWTYIGLYYGSLMYVDPTSWQHTTSYLDYIMEGTTEAFWKWASRLHTKGVDRHGVEDDVWIVPGQFFAMPYMYHGRYLFGGEAVKVGRVQ